MIVSPSSSVPNTISDFLICTWFSRPQKQKRWESVIHMYLTKPTLRNKYKLVHKQGTTVAWEFFIGKIFRPLNIRLALFHRYDHSTTRRSSTEHVFELMLLSYAWRALSNPGVSSSPHVSENSIKHTSLLLIPLWWTSETDLPLSSLTAAKCTWSWMRRR